MAESIYKIEKQEDVTIMTFKISNVIHDYNEEVKKAFSELFDKGEKKIIFDLFEIFYVSSVILASLVYMQKKAKESGGDLIFCNVQDRVRDIINMTCLDKVFDIVATREEALAKLK